MNVAMETYRSHGDMEGRLIVRTDLLVFTFGEHKPDIIREVPLMLGLYPGRGIPSGV